MSSAKPAAAAAHCHEHPPVARAAADAAALGKRINRIEGQVGEGGRFVSPALTIPLPAALASRPQGEVLTLAVRPENVRLGGDQPFSGDVQLVEPLGNQHVVWMNSGGFTVSAVLPGQPEVQEGAAVRFGFDAGKTLWFDAAGERIEA